MNSKDIYRTIRSQLADDFKEQGYQRVKGTFPSWTKLVREKFATVWFQAARQGGAFTIEFQYCSTPEPGSGKWNERRRFFGLLDHSEQRHVSDKFPKGGRTILGRISKRGNRYLRVLFVQAAWVVLIRPKSWERHGLKSWIEAAQKRLHPNVLAIALANKLARIAWGVLAHGRDFEVRKISEAAQSA